jgi:transposase-like protein
MARRMVKRFTAHQKLKIIKEGLLPNVRVADLCRHYEIYPTDYYRWKKLAESSMIDGLQPKKKREKPLSKREQALLKENERLQAVIIQLTKEHLELKKKVQESE